MKPNNFIKGFAKAFQISEAEALIKWQDVKRGMPEERIRQLERGSFNDGYMFGLSVNQYEKE